MFLIMMTERIYLVDIKGNLLNSIWIEQLYTRQWAHLICLYLTTGVHFSIIKCKSVHFWCNSIPTFLQSFPSSTGKTRQVAIEKLHSNF